MTRIVIVSCSCSTLTGSCLNRNNASLASDLYIVRFEFVHFRFNVRICVSSWSIVFVNDRLVAEGFFWIPSLASSTIVAARQSGSGYLVHTSMSLAFFKGNINRRWITIRKLLCINWTRYFIRIWDYITQEPKCFFNCFYCLVKVGYNFAFKCFLMQSTTVGSMCHLGHGHPTLTFIIRVLLANVNTPYRLRGRLHTTNKPNGCKIVLDRSLRDVLRKSRYDDCQTPFGSMTVVFGGDFRQVLPIIPKGSRQDIVIASLKQSYLWRHCKVPKLTANMRLTVGSRHEDVSEILDFVEWILKVGDGELGGANDGELLRHNHNFLLESQLS
ncbi:ATP-dependent DNA helicase PIF2 [Artemisia annua]|uniref:ATP-dependent DNA helicase n=1 Tax=Artemisia annua TaxID=35608 RepID=A0A2U1MEL1_ARTAN|nr:ATP-dependent DNA helicase PIF2 [Artemisia annua]